VAIRRVRSPDELDDWTDELPDRFLLCRDLGHLWRPMRAGIEARSYWRIMRCTRCHTERHQTLTMRGEIVSGHYVYPDGYLAPAGIGHMSGDHRSHLRLQSLTRLIQREAQSA
jgi:hypothetical protein